MLNFISKKLSLFFFIFIGTIFIVNSSVYAGTFSCSTTTATGCSGTIVYRMSATKDAHAALYNQTGAPYENNVVCCTGITGLGNSCSGTYATVLKLTATRNAHVQQTGSYTNNACLSVSSGTISTGYQLSNCRGYDTILGSMSSTTNAQVGDSNAYTTKICGTAAITPVISISVSDGIISYGILAPGVSKSTYELSNTQTITNESNVPVDIEIAGQNTTSWLLNDPGANMYLHEFCKATDVSCSISTNYDYLYLNYYFDLYKNVLPTETRKLDLRITMPTSTSSYEPQHPNITLLATEHSFICGDPVTFPYNGNTVTYGTVKGKAGACWMDRNLGASRVATAYNDSAAFGDYFQGGRLDDGHQIVTSDTTTTLSSDINPGHNKFIISSSSPYNWMTSLPNLWQGGAGNNNPCPSDWHVPWGYEWGNEKINGAWTTYLDAYNSILKLTVTGRRYFGTGTYINEPDNNWAEYWSADISSEYYRTLLLYGNSTVQMNVSFRGNGNPVRCIKN
jgi:hypothetical protein